MDERNEEKQNSYEIENIIGGSIPGRWKAGGRMRESKRVGRVHGDIVCGVNVLRDSDQSGNRFSDCATSLVFCSREIKRKRIKYRDFLYLSFFFSFPVYVIR